MKRISAASFVRRSARVKGFAGNFTLANPPSRLLQVLEWADEQWCRFVFWRHRSRLTPLIDTHPDLTLIFECREFHSEVVTAVAHQLTSKNRAHRIICSDALTGRLDPHPGHRFFLPTNQVRACLHQAHRHGMSFVCTTDYFGWPPFVIPPHRMSNSSGVFISHELDRLLPRLKADANSVLATVNDGRKSPFAALTLVRRPVHSNAGDAHNSQNPPSADLSSPGRSLLAMGHAGLRMEDLHQHSDLLSLQGLQFWFAGRLSATLKRLLEQFQNVKILDETGALSDQDVDRIVENSDGLIFLKDSNLYRTKWSGAAAHALTFGRPLLADPNLLALWGLPVISACANSGPECSSLLEQATTFSKLSNENLSKEQEILRNLGRLRFAESAEELYGRVNA